MNPARSTIFTIMSPEISYEILEAKKHEGLIWLLRESSVQGMLTVSFTLFSENIPVFSGNTRYALTKKGWICTSDLTDQVKEALVVLQTSKMPNEVDKALMTIQLSDMPDQMKEALKTRQFLSSKTADKYVNQLYKIITSKSFFCEFDSGTVKYPFDIKNRILPNQETQTSNKLYKKYIEV